MHVYGKEYENYLKLAKAERTKKEAYEKTNSALEKNKKKLQELKLKMEGQRAKKKSFLMVLKNIFCWLF